MNSVSDKWTIKQTRPKGYFSVSREVARFTHPERQFRQCSRIQFGLVIDRKRSIKQAGVSNCCEWGVRLEMRAERLATFKGS